MRGLEGGLDHLVELEVRFDLGLIQFVFRLAQLLGVIAPVPGSKREIAALLRNHFLQVVALGRGFGARPAPDVVEQVARRLRGLGHLIVEPVVGISVEAQEPRPLGAQGHDLGDQRAVVGCAAVLAAHDPGLEDFLAQVAARGELQETFARGTRQRDGVFAGSPALLRRGARGGAGKIRQAGEIALLQHEGVGLLVGQHVLPELGVEACQPLVDRRQAILRRLFQRGAGSHELGMVAVEHAGLLGVQPERARRRIQVGNAGIELGG